MGFWPRPWNDHRDTFSGILRILRSGAPWRDLPERYGSWSTVYDRFSRWQEDGTLDRICEGLQMRLDELGKIDWELFCVGATNVCFMSSNILNLSWLARICMYPGAGPASVSAGMVSLARYSSQ